MQSPVPAMKLLALVALEFRQTAIQSAALVFPGCRDNSDLSNNGKLPGHLW